MARTHVPLPKLEQDLYRVQLSTGTTFPQFIRLHNWLRMHSQLYYRWHLLRFTHSVHILVLLLYMASVTLVVRHYIEQPVYTVQSVPHKNALSRSDVSSFQLQDVQVVTSKDIYRHDISALFLIVPSFVIILVTGIEAHELYHKRRRIHNPEIVLDSSRQETIDPLE